MGKDTIQFIGINKEKIIYLYELTTANQEEYRDGKYELPVHIFDSEVGKKIWKAITKHEIQYKYKSLAKIEVIPKFSVAQIAGQITTVPGLNESYELIR